MGNILQEIFRDNHAEFMLTTRPRKAVIENVDKMIDCAKGIAKSWLGSFIPLQVLKS